jgi:tetratricopeptide (TPR) repeat protein
MVKGKHMEPEFEEEEMEEEIEEEIRQARKGRTGRKKKKKPAEPRSREPSHPSSIFYLHSLFLFGGRLLGGMLNFYNSLFELSPRDKTKIYRNINAHYAKKGQHEKGLHYLKEWTRLDPTNPDGHYQLGVALAASGNLKGSIRAFDKALKLKPDHKGAIFRKSRIYLKLKDYKSASEGLEKLVNLVPENHKALYLLGIGYDRMDEVDKAVEAFEKAVEIAPEEIKYHQHLGFLYERKEDHKQAAKCFSRVMDLEREQEEEAY